MTSPNQPYAGVRIIDLAGLASAYGTRLLAALGAEVIVPEPPEGSPLRRLAPFAPGAEPPESSLWWAYFAQGKRSVVVDTDGDLARLVGGADAVFEAEPAERSEALRAAAAPDTVWVSVTPFGRTGPRSHWKGSDLVAWASSGVLNSIGFPDRPPVAPAAPVQLTYHVASMHAMFAAQVALRVRRRSGVGQHIDISIQEAALSVGPEVGPSLYLDDLVPRPRPGNRRSVTRPFGLYPCSDGYVSLLALQPAHWRAMAAWISEVTGEDGVLDEAFNDPVVRWEAAEFVDAMTEAVTSSQTKLEVFTGAQARGIPCSPVNTVADLRSDPHLLAAGFWRSDEHPEIGELPTPGPPFRTPAGWWSWTRAPLLGEHTEAVLGAAGTGAEPATATAPTAG